MDRQHECYSKCASYTRCIICDELDECKLILTLTAYGHCCADIVCRRVIKYVLQDDYEGLLYTLGRRLIAYPAEQASIMALYDRAFGAMDRMGMNIGM